MAQGSAADAEMGSNEYVVKAAEKIAGQLSGEGK